MFRDFVAGKEAHDDANDRDVLLAARVATLSKAKNIAAAAKSMLAKRIVKQNVKQMRTVLQQISEAYRIPLRKKKKKKKR